MKSLRLLLLVLTTSLLISACTEFQTMRGGTDEIGDVNIDEPTAGIDQLASAKRVYKENCAECHRDDGTGGPIGIDGRTIRVPDFTSDQAKRLPDKAYLRYIRNGDGEEGMPAFKDRLSNKEMVGLVKLIRSEFQDDEASPR